MPRSIYQAGPSPRRPVTPQQGPRGATGARGASGSSGRGPSFSSGGNFRPAWGTGGNEGNFAGFEFDRWSAASRAGRDASQWAGGPGGVEGRFRGERRGVEDRSRGDRNRAAAENTRRWDTDRRDRRFADMRRRFTERRNRREDRQERQNVRRGY